MASSAHIAPSPGTSLLEREDDLAVLHGAFSEVRAGRGRLVLVAGETGVGKTSLVNAFCASARGSARVLEGSCDALATPRALGAFADLAVGASDRLRAQVAAGVTAHELFEALCDELGTSPAVIVLEDLHWADEATLDVVRVLGRRIESVPALVVATYREEAVVRDHPLRIVLGDLARMPGLSRLTVEPFSPAAVAELAAGYEIDAGELYRLTGGNPFYVGEVLDAGAGDVPATVSDAVHARASRLSPGARQVLEAVSIAPPAVELWVLDRVCGEAAAAVDDCLACAMLAERGNRIGFRHELARASIESALGPARSRDLHRALLAALACSPEGADPARLAHHAEGARDAVAVLELAPAAAQRAAQLGAHREAAAQYARALRFAGARPPQERAALLARLADAQYATDDQVDSIASWNRAIDCYREAGDVAGEAESQCRLVTNYGCRGAMDDARAAGARAVELAESLGDAPVVGSVYASMALLELYEGGFDACIEWGQRSVAIARAAGDGETLVDAMTSAGCAEFLRDGATASGTLEQALGEARSRQLVSGIPRVLNNLAAGAVEHNVHDLANRSIEEGLAHCAEHDLDLWTLSLLGLKARSKLAQGHFEVAAEVASQLAEDMHDSPAPRFEGLQVLALVRARRGDPGVHPALDQAMAMDCPADEVDWAGPLAVTRAEIAWLEGRADQIDEITAPAFALARATSSVPWVLGALAGWRRRAGLTDRLRGPRPAEPWALELAGRHVAAVAAWDRLGRPYEAAIAQGMGGRRLEDAHARLRDLGADAPAAIFARRLRQRGVRGISRGPRPSTRENPANLTARELEVLALLGDGLMNAQIAQRLHLSVRTVDHHVSSILRKLDVPSRAHASIEAMRLGISSTVP
ncbi:MAG: ATP-binding protein [Gaiellales bacterium]